MNDAAEKRLALLRSTGLLDSPAEAAFDRLTRLAATLVGAPVALVSLVDDGRQFFKSAIGLNEPWASLRETPLTHSFCKYAVRERAPLVVGDARLHPMLRENPAIGDLGVVAYAGVPLVVQDQALGVFCVIDDKARDWTAKDLRVLEDLAACVASEIELRVALRAADAQRALNAALVDGLADAVIAIDTEGTFLLANRAARALYPVAEPGKPAPVSTWTQHTRSRGADGGPLDPTEGPLVRAVAGKDTDGLVFTIRAPGEKNDRWIEASGRPVRGERGGVIAGVAVYRDITARMRQESLHSAMFRQSPLALVISDSEGRVVEANQAAATLYQRAGDEMVGRTSADLGLVPPEVRRRLLDRLRAEAGLSQEEITINQADGSQRIVVMSVRAVDVGPRLYVTTFLDVTQRRAIEGRYKQIVETTRDAIVISDASGRYVFANTRADEMLGYATGELLGRHVLDIIADGDQTQAARILERRRHGIHGSDEIRVRRKDGSTIWIEIAASSVALDAPGQVGTLSMVRDVTDRKRAEALLGRERALLAATLEHASDGIALLDRNRRILLANPCYEAFFGLSRERLATLDRDSFLDHLVTLADEDPARMRARFVERAAQAQDYAFVRPRRRVLRRSEVPLRLPEGDAFLVTWQDVTAERDLLAERERQLLVDALTGIANRRAAEAALILEDARRRRFGTPLAVALVDVDHFKSVNDVHGHATGDEVLRIVAASLAAQARPTDLVARWGGEEFLAVLVGASLPGAVAFGERARSGIEGTHFPRIDRLTISVGVAEVLPDETPLDAIARADERLYDAKRRGRNQVAS